MLRSWGGTDQNAQLEKADFEFEILGKCISHLDCWVPENISIVLEWQVHHQKASLRFPFYCALQSLRTHAGGAEARNVRSQNKSIFQVSKAILDKECNVILILKETLYVKQGFEGVNK